MSQKGPYDRTRNMEHIIVPRASWTRIAMRPSCLGRTMSRARLRARPFFLTFYRWKSLRLLRGLLRGGRPPRFRSKAVSLVSLLSPFRRAHPQSGKYTYCPHTAARPGRGGRRCSHRESRVVRVRADVPRVRHGVVRRGVQVVGRRPVRAGRREQ